MDSVAIIIPARYASSRFPGKPLADILGKPMIQHVYEKAQSVKNVEVIVATDDERILETVVNFGGKGVLTGSTHISGTDRLVEVMSKVEHFITLLMNAKLKIPIPSKWLHHIAIVRVTLVALQYLLFETTMYKLIISSTLVYMPIASLF